MVDVVDLLSQWGESGVGRGGLLGEECVEFVGQRFEVGGCELLSTVGECVGRVGMDFDYETVEFQLHGCQRQGFNELAVSTNVTGVAEDGQAGTGASQLERQLPKGRVAIALGVVHAEPAVDGGKVTETYLREPFDGTEPQAHVGAEWIFYHDMRTGAAQGFGQLLDHEGVGGGSGSNP